MRCKTTIGCLALTSLLTVSYGRQKVHQEEQNRSFFIEPRESTLPVIVNQPDCPLAFEQVRLLHYTGGGGLPDYRVSNVSSKPIAEFDVATVGLGGGGNLGGFKASDRSQWIMPLHSWPLLKDDSDTGQGHHVEIVPLTDALRKQHRVGPPIRTVLFLMVVRVKFGDGTTYTDEGVYKELRDLCEKIDPPDN